MRTLWQQYEASPDVAFAVIEQQEPHAGRMAFAAIEQPTTFAARCALARRLRDELEVPLPIFVDGMDDASRALFSDLPSPAFVIDRQGRIADKLPWADPKSLQQTLVRLVAADPIPEAKAGPWTLEQRDAIARRLCGQGKHGEALAWLDATADPQPSVSPSLTATALAAITRVQAMRDAEPALRAAAVAAALQAADLAWPADAARLTAARIELAEAVATTATAASLWQAALAGLDQRAPTATRAWIAQRAGKPTGR